MSRDIRKPQVQCCWCGKKLQRGKALRVRQGFACPDAGCVGSHPAGKRPPRVLMPWEIAPNDKSPRE